MDNTNEILRKDIEVIFQRFFICCQLIGIELSLNKTRQNTVFRILKYLAYLFLLFESIRTITTFYQLKFSKVNVMQFIMRSSAIAMKILFIKKRNALSTIARRLTNVCCEMNCHKEFTQIKLKILIITYFLWITHIVVQTSLYFTFIGTEQKKRSRLRSLLLGNNPEILMKYSTVLLLLNVIASQLAWVSIAVILSVYLLNILSILIAVLQRFKKIMLLSSPTEYSKLLHIANRLDHILYFTKKHTSLLLSTITVKVFCMLQTNIMVLINFDTASRTERQVEIVGFFILHFGMFFVVTISASLVQEARINLLVAAHKLSPTKSTRMRCIFIAKLQNLDASFEVFGHNTLTRSFILAAIGSMISYFTLLNNFETTE